MPDAPPSLLRRLGPAGVLAIAAAVLPLLGWLIVPATMPQAGAWLKDHEATGLLLYVAGFAALTGLALMPTHLLAALGGFAFGLKLGAPASVAGFILGAALGYEIARLASRERVIRVIDENARWRAVKHALMGPTTTFPRALWIVLLLRLPLTPFAAVNLLLASVRVGRGPYLLGTLLGMTPRTILAVVIGTGIKETFSSEAVKESGPKWAWWAGIAITAAVVIYVGNIASKALDRLTAQDPAEPPTPSDSPKVG
jgi:uncharacterized membrane protein YdjX (TVP38/TMEM64 family)